MLGLYSLEQLVKSLKRKPSLTTNLVYKLPTKDWFEMFGGIATSWNLSGRFNDLTYHIWLMNLKKLHIQNIPVTVLVTVTDDLIHLSAKEFNDKISEWKDFALEY